MQFNTNNKGKTDFRWDTQKLIEIKNKLIAGDKFNDPVQLELLDTLIGDKDAIKEIAEQKELFSTEYAKDVHALHYDYYSHLDSVRDFLDAFQDKEFLYTDTSSLSQINLSSDDFLDLVYDFFKDLDKNWFNIFTKLYYGNNSYLFFSENPSFSLSFNKANIWLANVSQNGTIAEGVDLAHEFGHGIQDVIANKKEIYSADNILIEMFPLLCQKLFLDYLKKHNIAIRECHVFDSITESSIVDEAASIVTKFEITSMLPSMSNARNLRRVLKNRMDIDMSTDSLTALFSVPVEQELNYVIPYAVMMKLYEIYQFDKDEFIHNVNKILHADSKVETAKELKLM